MLPLRDNITARTLPAVNYLIIAGNVAVFLHEVALGRHLDPFISRYGIVPSVWTSPHAFCALTLQAKLLPLATSMFLHGGLMHIVSNLWCLLIFGDAVEDRLGHLRYLFFYLAAGLGSGAIHLLSNWGSPVPTIGASGAIAGVMGGYFILFPYAKVRTLVPIFFFWQVIDVPAVFFLGLWFLSQIYNGMASLGGDFGGIAWWAHIGGFGLGVYLVPKLLPRGRRKVFYTIE